MAPFDQEEEDLIPANEIIRKSVGLKEAGENSIVMKGIKVFGEERKADEGETGFATVVPGTYDAFKGKGDQVVEAGGDIELGHRRMKRSFV